MDMLFLRRNRLLLLGLLILVMIAGGVYWWFFSLPEESADTFTGEYELILEDYDGNPVELAEYKRDLLVAHVWASWCPYCGEELQNLMRLKDEYGDTVRIIAVNRAEPEAEAKAFTRSLGIDPSAVELLLDPEDSFFKSIGGYAMPETIFINARGEIIYHQRGPMKVDEVIAHLDTLIGREE